MKAIITTGRDWEREREREEEKKRKKQEKEKREKGKRRGSSVNNRYDTIQVQ